MRDGWVEATRAFARRHRGWLVALVAIVLALVLGRGWLSERLVPDPRLNRQLELAQAALRQGRLSEPGGQGARERFEAVLAADPDQMQARQGLVDVRNAAIVDAQQSLARGDTTRARTRIALAEALSAPAVQLQPLRERLREREGGSGDVARLLAEVAAPGVDEEIALADLQEALRIAPGQEVALAAREALLAGRLRRADAALDAGRLPEAQALVDGVVAADPAHLDLPAVQGRIGEALARRQASRGTSLAAAGVDERAGRLDAAARRYLALRDGDPADADARAGIERVATLMAARAQRQAADFKFAAAEASLRKAQTWSPDTDAVREAERRIQQSRDAGRRLRHPPTPAERRRVAVALAAAREAMGRGDLLSPPGSSAWDQLRVAQALSPDDRAVRVAQREFAAASTRCFESALQDNQLRRAQECLEASQAAQPVRAGLADDRRRLVERWAARAEERLGASDWPAAEAALSAARRWQPRDARLQALAARLRLARAASP